MGKSVFNPQYVCLKGCPLGQGTIGTEQMKVNLSQVKALREVVYVLLEHGAMK